MSATEADATASHDPIAPSGPVGDRVGGGEGEGDGDDQREAAARRRIDRLLTINLAIVALVITGMLAVQLFALSSPWILTIIVLTALYGTSLAWAKLQNRRGRLGRAVLIMNAAVWPLAIVATVLVPEALPMTCLSGLSPVLLSVPELGRRAVARILGASVVLTALVVAIGTLAPGTSVGDEVSPWILDVAIAATVPVLVGLTLLIGAQNHHLLTDRTEALRRSRAGVAEAADRERRRIERDLHDGAQQRLHGALVQLSVAHRLLGTDPARARGFVSGARQELVEAITDLGDLVQGTDPSGLRSRGLVALLGETVARRTPAGMLRTVGVGRLPPAIESAVWFCCMEAIANVDKHAGPGAQLWVRLDQRDGELLVAIDDDGPGLPAGRPLAASGGLRNMQERLRSVGGTLTVRSSPEGTSILGTVPVPRPERSERSERGGAR